MISSVTARVRRALGAGLVALITTASGFAPVGPPAAHAAPPPDLGRSVAARVDPSLVVHAERVAARDAFLASARRAERSGTPAEVAVAVALEQIGKPYRTAGKGPDRFDCSGLTGFAWAAAGVDLPPSSRRQFAGLPHVDLDELLPGDLLFRGSPIHHVSMYVGDGMIVHAPQTGEFVRVEAGDFSRVVGAARPWEAPADEKAQTERVAPTTSQRSPE